MVSQNDLMRIFWPSDAPREPNPGVLVGFQNSKLDLFIVAVLQNVQVHAIKNALLTGLLLQQSPHNIQELLRRCGHGSLRVLGCLNPQTIDPSDSLLIAYTDASARFPRLEYPVDTRMMLQVIIYDRPHPTQMQYLSPIPISLALDNKSDIGKWSLTFEGAEEAEKREQARKAKLAEKLKLHTVIAYPTTKQETALSMIVDQINCSFELNGVLQKNCDSVGGRLKRTPSVTERVMESANNIWDYLSTVVYNVWKTWFYPVLSMLFISGLLALRVAGEVVLRILDWRAGSPDSPALKDVSATAQQLDIRLQQFCYWPVQYLTLRQRKDNWESITNSHPEYIRFFNSLWLVANDIIIGMALGSYIIENSVFVATQVDTIFNVWAIEGLRDIISWLMEWPGGLKLNTELAEFMGDLFLWVIDNWAGGIAVVRPHLPHMVYLIGFSAFAGATVPISLFADVASLLTLHIYAFYVASARIFHWQLTIIVSLFHLFRGKKRNVLRNRIDSCDYDLDQLLLGTILFTLLIFLLPTVFVFYLTFATARVAVIGLKAALEISLACLNHFPLFALMLRVKDSRRLPGGIYFELQDSPAVAKSPPQASSSAPTSYVLLKSLPLPLRAIFDSYFELGNRLRKHYLSPSVIFALSSGQFVPPIHRRNLYSLQYGMLPARRAGIAELWKQFNSNELTPMDKANVQPSAFLTRRGKALNGNGPSKTKRS
ncbi:Gpi1-domain-containing protein [Periconia macrospinosa]|uniref:Gpi1-domain-containing protein n=1 Tax=Periconia macrospinosa TaxID=97972 RepID=A0A2V1ECB4_9PLEO|nr:Gpi1-domain-containing protein [Periconia macrospinosa]